MKNSLIISLFTVVILIFTFNLTVFADNNKVLTISHRGASGYAPENTIAAFDKSIEMGADYIELDVQMTKDGKLVVIHDTTVDRTTNGSGNVKDLTYAELRKLDAGTWFDESFSNEQIPTLKEVIKKYRWKTGILIEIKSPSLYPGIEENLKYELLENKFYIGYKGKIIVQSFNFNSVQLFHDIMPSIPVGVLINNSSDLTVDKLKTFSSYSTYINPHYSLLTEDLVNKIHDLNMFVHTWTVRDYELVEPLINGGVDGIITDYPDYVLSY